MTDKEQTIIDGVDVTKCPISEKCKEFENCKIQDILKQLARKTDACEKWKSYYDLYRFDQELLKKIQGVINSHPKYGIELTDTCIIDKDERLSSLEVHEQIKLIFDETLQECEALRKFEQETKDIIAELDRSGSELLAEKNALEIGRDEYKQECEELKKEIVKLQTGKFNELGRALDREARYRKAFGELEEYCRQNRQAGWIDIEGILDIISKAKGDE